MSSKKYLFFIDIDNTLVPVGTSKVSQEIVNEIERLKNLGHIFIISTGRALNTTENIKGIEVFNYLSTALGCCIYKMPSKQLLNKPKTMETEDVKKFVEMCKAENLLWSYRTEREDKTIFTDCDFFKNIAKDKLVSVEDYYNDLTNNKIIQLLSLGCLPKEKIKEFPNFDFFVMPEGHTDVALKNFSKGSCVNFFKTMYPQYSTVSIGDSLNDIPMFEKTDISIAMGNAKDEVKEKATFVTKNILDNGLIYAFKEILKL